MSNTPTGRLELNQLLRQTPLDGEKIVSVLLTPSSLKLKI